MKNIRLFRNLLCFTLVTMLSVAHVGAQQATQEVNGKVTFVIEKKPLTAQQAQSYITSKQPISLKVSVIFEGQWVSLFDNGFRAYLNSSFFSFGIAQKDGTDEASAPLFRTNPPAYIYANELMGCKAPDGGSLDAPYMPLYIEAPSWERHDGVCPTFAYGAEFSNSSNLNGSYLKKTTYNGNECYELDLMYLNFRLKDLQTVYVRGIDCNNASDGVPSTDNESSLGGATVGTTILNLINHSSKAALYWPKSPSQSSADWTLAPSAYYGGIIPGGIFIEQAPEAAQFEPSITFSFIEKKR
ncbi:MAG: hypothetical protein K2L03_07835 [Bacteroidales bacterium]|nr:hypothetical protein [Bacteroidales bacterium]